jgi:hypothetical protein
MPHSLGVGLVLQRDFPLSTCYRGASAPIGIKLRRQPAEERLPASPAVA